MARKKSKNTGLQHKMMLICLAVLSIMTIFCLIAIRVSLKIYDDKLYERSILELEYFANLVKNEMDDVETLSFEIAMDSEFQRQLAEMNVAADKQVRWTAMSSFKDKMNVESLRDHTITEIIYDNQKDIKYEIRNAGMEIPKNLYELMLQKANEGNGAYVYMNPTQDFPYILSGRIIRNRMDLSLSYLGTLIIAYDMKAIFDENLEVLSGIENHICVLSEDGMVYTNNEELFRTIPAMTGTVGYDFINYDGNKYFRCFLKSEKTGWTFINANAYDSIYETHRMINKALIVGAIILFVVCTIVLRKMCVIITAPLTNLAQSMRIVENGDFEKAKTILLPIESHDEVGLLNKEFRIMLDKIGVLIKENYEKQITLIDTKYRALQAQINPHFLYNTLNSIGWMIKAQRNEEAQKMLTALGSQLRAAFREETIATLAEEVELLQNYIYIQKMRYDKRVMFEMQIQEEVLQTRVPRLLLQPLVENAITYGVENMEEVCTICINAYRKEKDVVIQISDNGMGMDKVRLKEVRNFTMQPRQNGIGLKNIKQRLELLLGKSYQFRIDSEDGKGTRIEIVVPLDWGDTRDQHGNY